MRAYKFGQKWEIGQKSPASTCLRKTDAANPIKPFRTSRNQRFRKFWSLLLRMPEAGPFAISVALAVYALVCFVPQWDVSVVATKNPTTG